MEMQEIIKKYFIKNVKVFEKIEEFGERRELNLFQKLKDDENEINVYSWQAEIMFGLCFDRFSEKIIFDTKIEKGIKPDWTIICNGQKIIAEVLRINTSEKDMLENLEWEKYVGRHNSQHPETPIMGWTRSYGGSSEFFYGHQSKIEKKETTFGPFVNREKLPFIICVQSTLATVLGQRDAADFFHTGQYGIFYTNETMRMNVTGILFFDYFGQKRFYQNDLCENRLNDANQKIFANIEKICSAAP